jgi:hypothetical protein
LTTTGSDAGKALTVYGTDAAGASIYEVLTAVSTGTSYTNLDFKTVTSITPSAAFLANVTVGTNAIASSPWVRFDEYSTFPTAIQVSVTTAMGSGQTYTVQQTLHDSNSPTNPVAPYMIQWMNSPDPAMIQATVTAQSSYTYAPNFSRVVLNYNAPAAATTGAVSAVFTQNSSSSF